MRSLLFTWLVFVAAAVAAPVQAAEPIPAIAPPPAWIVAPDIPSIDPAKAGAPMQFLLTSTQEKLRPDGQEQYVRYLAVPQNTVGLQALGTVAIPWQVDRVDLVLHGMAIRRGGSVIDLLSPDDITVLRRETNLEQAMLDGVRTVVMTAKGLQIGDVLDVSFSFKAKPVSVGGKPESIVPLRFGLPIALVERRFLVPDEMNVRWNLPAEATAADISRRDGMTEHLFVQRAVVPPTVPEFVPERFKIPLLQMSSYADWSEISEQLVSLYANARRLPNQSSLAGEAERIAAASSDPGQRTLAALRLAQEQVRYVALLLGEGSYLPASAEETWERKFGDCKGKTALLLALLDRLGIEAEPVLVSAQFNDRLGMMLPSLAAFDHVLVRARIDGRNYYLDATNYGQRTLSEVAGTSFRHGLAVRARSDLEELPAVVPEAPHREASLVWKAAGGVDGAVPFEATLVLRGAEAAAMRAKLAAASDAEEFDTGLKQLMPVISNDDLNIAEKTPEADDGSFTVRFTGEAEMDWAPLEGERNTRYAFDQSTLQWDVKFDRGEGEARNFPFFIGDELFWQRMTETVILPNGGRGFSVDGEPVDKSVAGSLATRSFRTAGDRVTMVADFRHLQREISAAEARAAQPAIDDLKENYAFIVGPPERKRRPRRDVPNVSLPR